MKFEDGFTSLELSRRLRDSGVPQESDFYWVRPKSSKTFALWFYEKLSTPTGETKDWEQVSAFSVAELIDILPEGTVYRKFQGDWHEVLLNPGNLSDGFSAFNGVDFFDETAANALGKAVGYLKEKGLLPEIGKADAEICKNHGDDCEESSDPECRYSIRIEIEALDGEAGK